MMTDGPVRWRRSQTPGNRCHGGREGSETKERKKQAGTNQVRSDVHAADPVREELYAVVVNGVVLAPLDVDVDHVDAVGHLQGGCAWATPEKKK